MIQRIQSILLLLAAGAFGALFALPFAATAKPVDTGIYSDGVYNLQDHIALIVLTVLGIVVAVGAIFLFRNRTLQMRVSYLGMALAIALPIVAVVIMGDAAQSAAAAGSPSSYKAGLFLPAVALVLFGLANFFIRKDDKLVKSMDRLR